jgi:hypothetical protein
MITFASRQDFDRRSQHTTCEQRDQRDQGNEYGILLTLVTQRPSAHMERAGKEIVTVRYAFSAEFRVGTKTRLVIEELGSQNTSPGSFRMIR